MRFGIRKPSIERSIRARTTGKIKKTILLIVNILLLSSLFANCSVKAIAVTKDNLNLSLKKLVTRGCK